MLRAPLVPDTTWVPDSAYGSCFRCSAAFGLLLRRHHCRLCGQIFCAKCSARLVPVGRDARTFFSLSHLLFFSLYTVARTLRRPTGFSALFC
jgi:hypothetical protein